MQIYPQVWNKPRDRARAYDEVEAAVRRLCREPLADWLKVVQRIDRVTNVHGSTARLPWAREVQRDDNVWVGTVIGSLRQQKVCGTQRGSGEGLFRTPELEVPHTQEALAVRDMLRVLFDLRAWALSVYRPGVPGNPASAASLEALLVDWVPFVQSFWSRESCESAIRAVCWVIDNAERAGTVPGFYMGGIAQRYLGTLNLERGLATCAAAWQQASDIKRHSDRAPLGFNREGRGRLWFGRMQAWRDQAPSRWWDLINRLNIRKRAEETRDARQRARDMAAWEEQQRLARMKAMADAARARREAEEAAAARAAALRARVTQTTQRTGIPGTIPGGGAISKTTPGGIRVTPGSGLVFPGQAEPEPTDPTGGAGAGVDQADVPEVHPDVSTTDPAASAPPLKTGTKVALAAGAVSAVGALLYLRRR